MTNGYLFKTTHKLTASWEGVCEYEENNSYIIPQEGGVYEILVKNKNSGRFMRGYVGQAENLHKRYLEHLSDEEENSKIRESVREYVCGFDYALIGGEDDRKDAEKALYEKYDYAWNEKKPGGSGRDLDIKIVEYNLQGGDN